MSTGPIPPPYFITADDKRGLIVVTVAIVLAFVWVCSLIRIWLRFQARDWKADDWLLSAATILHTVQSGILLHLVDLGLGASQDGLELSQLQRLGRQGIATQILYTCTLFLSKCSVLFLYFRLSPGGKHKYATYGVFAACLIWVIMAIILIVIPCNPAQYYTNPAQCTNRWQKWQAIGALDIATEAFIFGIAVQLVWSLQMRTKAKLIVIFAFSARLPVIAIAAVRLHYLHRRFRGDNNTFEYLVATQWQMGYAIMASTITGMGPFLSPFNKEYTTSYHKRSAYGNGYDSSQRSQGMSVSREATESRQPQRSSWQSEGYLMQPISSRRGSRTTLSDTIEPSTASHVSATHTSMASVSTIPDPHQSSPSSQAPNMLTADANFRPVDHVSRNDTEIWVGDRNASFGTEEGMPAHSRENRGLVINKRTQFKVEVDRTSRVV